ncbi:MAG: FAD-binding oxidoreductase [Rhodospirillaceae bacterium]|jgi:FAD-dependent oxidoreductase domain-containing protein 1|nr:FAD-binding oxidoreductase [Rhodospirillaceae bacterium]MBT5665320.1 FAD-binding oxidoreductase [Rhodospirillaceae bacterium]
MADIVIIGGSIMGSSIAYHLAMAGHAGDIVVIEPDPTYEWAAAPRSSGGVRLMHGLPENIEMSRYGREVYKDFANLMDVDGEPGRFDFKEFGYLFMVSGAADTAVIEENWRVQTGLGVKNDLLDRDGLAQRFPSFNVDGVDAALHAPEDGFIDPHAAVIGFRRKARSLGVEYIQDRVVGFDADATKVTGVVLESGRRVDAGVVVNVAGAWGPALCEMIGMKVPVEPMRRMTFYFETRDELEEFPLTKSPGGVSFRTEGAGYTAGWTRDEPGGFNWEVEQDLFDKSLWPALAHRVPKFESLKVMRSWAGHYAVNRMDGNTIIGPWVGGLENFYVATGFTGAGLQKGPAIGRAMTELLLHGEYQTLDLSRMSYQRVIDEEPLIETGFTA